MNTSICTDEIAQLHAFITAKTGLLFTNDRLHLILPVCKELLLETGLTDMAALTAKIQTDQALLDTLLSRITIPESYFFRDPEHFDFIQYQVLPELKKQKNDKELLTLWSAGCAGGEEAYSLAIMMEQAGWLTERYQILASDISRKALQKARKGVYSAWSFRGQRAMAVQADVLQRQSNSLVVPERYTQKVRFFYFNLATANFSQQNPLLDNIDVIFCRNVFIYFHNKTIAQISEQLFHTLAKGGYLILGPSDPVISHFAPFEVIQTKHGLVYRKPLTKAKSETSIKHLLTGVEIKKTAAVKTLKQCKTQPASRPPIVRKAGEKTQSNKVETAETELIKNLYQQAIQHFEHQTYDLALNHLRQIMYLNNNLPEAHFTAGLTCLKLGLPEQANSYFLNAFELASQLPSSSNLTLVKQDTAGQVALAAKRLLATTPVNRSK